MGRQADHSLSIALGLRDGFSKEMGQAVSAAKKAAKDLGASDKEIEKSARKVESAFDRKISASKSVELAVRKQAAAGDVLETQLAELDHEYEKIVVKMRALAKAGSAIPPSMMKQAGAIRQNVTALREQKMAADEANKTFDKFKITGMAATAWALGMASAIKALNLAMEMLGENLPSLKDLNGEWSTMDKTLGSIKDTIQDSAFQELNLLEKGMVVAYRAVNTELAEAEAGQKRLNDAIERREHASKAAVAGIREEVEQEKLAQTVRAGNRQKLADLDKRVAEKRKARAAQRKRDNVEAENAARAYALAEEERMRSQAEKRRVARGQEMAAKLQADNVEREMIATQNSWIEQKEKESAEKRSQIQSETAAQVKTALTAMGSMWGSVFGEMAAGSEDASKTAASAVVSTAETAITAASASAAAQAAFSQAGIPIIGPILAATASSAIFGMVRGFLAKMEHGGVLSGGTPGRDSAMFMGQQGERVLSVSQTESFDRLVNVLEGQEAGGGFGGGAKIELSIPIDSPSEMTNQQMKRWWIRNGRIAEELIDDGLIFNNLQRAS